MHRNQCNEFMCMTYYVSVVILSHRFICEIHCLIDKQSINLVNA